MHSGLERKREAWDRGVYFRVFGEEVVTTGRGEDKITGDIIKGKKRKGLGSESLEARWTEEKEPLTETESVKPDR